MNPWDVFTWFCSAALAVSGVWIFAFFLKDVGRILNRDLHSSRSSRDEAPANENQPD